MVSEPPATTRDTCHALGSLRETCSNALPGFLKFDKCQSLRIFNNYITYELKVTLLLFLVSSGLVMVSVTILGQ